MLLKRQMNQMANSREEIFVSMDGKGQGSVGAKVEIIEKPDALAKEPVA